MRNINKNNSAHLDSRMLSYAARMLFIGALIALIVIIGMQQSCNSVGSLSGVYINTAGSEFSIASDTLVVEHVEGDLFLIHRKTGFRLLDEKGKPGKLQHETEEWTAVFDAKTKQMTEKRHGKSISFSDDHTVMTVGMRKYQRIN